MFNASAKTVTLQFVSSGQQNVNNISVGDSIVVINATGSAQSMNVAVNTNVLISNQNAPIGGVIYAFKLSNQTVVDIYTSSYSIVAKFQLNYSPSTGVSELEKNKVSVRYSNKSLMLDKELNEAELFVYDLTGRMIQVADVSALTMIRLSESVNTGLHVYVLVQHNEVVATGKFFKS